MCDKSPEKSKQFVAEKLCDNESVVTQKNIQYVPSSIIYPKANLYYAFAEDRHPSTRIAVSKSLQREKFPPPVAESPWDPCSEIEAVNHYLLSDPPSFVVFGKPGLNSVDLATAIADAWKCVLISPSTLIQQEINNSSEEGRRMKETLGNGERIASNIVMNLIRRRIKMRDVKHRGYVVEGLPLIPDEPSPDRGRFEFFKDQTCDRTAFCSHQVDDIANPRKLPDESICEELLDYEKEILQQINEMFTEWTIKPSIIVYMVCPKQDIVSLIMHQRTETATTNVVVENTLGDRSDLSSDLRQDTKEQPIESDDRRNNYLGRVSDVMRKVELQCNLYMRLALPVIDRWILAHDPQRVIRVDGRGSTHRILHTVNARLRMLPLCPAILPEQMIVENDDLELFQDEINAKAKGQSGKNEEKIFEILRQKGIVSTEFPWRLSAWKFYCPVELAAGRRRIGCSKYVVQFLGNIFFLSSNQALDMFCENPRTFLSPPNPRPTCKIAVIGPRCSGKSKLSQRLAEVFGGMVINVNKILETLSKKDIYKNMTHTSMTENDQKILCDYIVRAIEEIPKEKLENYLYRDCGYVVDGVPIHAWYNISKKIEFEDVVILFNRPSHIRGTEFLGDMETMTDYKIELENAENDYNKDLETFTLQMNSYNWLKDDKLIGERIECDVANIKDVTEYVVNCLKHPYKIMNIAETEISKKTTSTKDNTNSTNEKTKENGEENEKEYSPRVVDLETAERLLDCGYYFLSPFGRRCPVQAYANEIPIVHGATFSIVHHAYIYFLDGEEALSAFLKEPSKYLTQDFRLSALPLRIAIIGPPKCGKTTLADRFAKTYGMKRITRDIALRHMLKHYSWTESARMAENRLQAGQPTSSESVAHAIETISLSPRATSQGYVLDDYPSSREAVERLTLSGVQPMIVLDLKTDLSFLLECQAENNDSIGISSSSDFLTRYENWQLHQASFRNWLKRFSRNVVELDATRSKWSVWTIADREVRSRFAEIALYHREADLGKVHSLRYMCVSPFEFRQRQSRYESYCPVCLFREDILQASRQPTDNQGMVQFKEHFYWICPSHMTAFIEDPQQYLPPVNTATLPDERPRILEQLVDVGHACWERRLRFDGWCPVTYIEGPAEHKLTRGRADLAVLLGEEEVYLFCCEKCRDKFLAKHSKYRNVEITVPHEIDPRYLPDTDFLERTVTKQVVEAVKRVAAHRPKIVGLSPAASAAIHIGVHLKMHNASAELDEVIVYEVADERMAGRDKIIRIVTDTVKTRPNPYVVVDGEQRSLES